MRQSEVIRGPLGWSLGLAAGVLLASAAGALQPGATEKPPQSAQVVLASWESADLRLTALRDKLPAQARKGIERAISANREGRQNAELALRRGDEARALRAFEIASAHAEIGFNQARSLAPESLLPELEAAAAQMNRRQPATISGLVAAPSIEVKPPGG